MAAKIKSKKSKLIHLTETTLIHFSVAAAKEGTTAKPYIQNILEKIAEKSK